MQHAEAKQGRIFIIRLEDGEILHEAVETFACQNGVRSASLIAVGGVDAGSRLVVGPEDGRGSPVVPMEYRLEAVHEVCGTGTLFPDEDGHLILHMHVACGRGDKAVTGCVRRGVRVWHVLEIVVTELVDCRAARVQDAATGFALLQPGGVPVDSR